MEIQTVLPSRVSAPDLLLGDLFVPRANPDSPNARHTSNLPTALAAAHLLPDTPFAGAWLLLQSRWLGTLWPTLEEASLSPNASHGRTQRLSTTAAYDATRAAGDWLAELDQARRVSAEAPLSAQRPDVLWLRQDIDTAYGTDAALRLRFDAPSACLHIDSAVSLLDAAALGALLAAIADTAADLLARPDAALGDIRTLPRADSDTQLTAWNTAVSPLDRSLTVTGLFRQQAQSAPEATAVAEGELCMSYAELDQRSDELAHRLQRLGVRGGDSVGLLLDRSMAAVVAMLGILKAGAAYVPVPTDFPSERIAYMLGETHAHHVLTEQAHHHLVPPKHAVLLLDEYADKADRSSWNPPSVDGESVAYVMYTSGSTGTPKGIEICHRSILRLVAGVDYVELAAGRAVLHAAPLAFDAATLEVWGPLLNGGCCVIHDERVPTGAGLARTIARHDVHTAWLTAALFNAVVDDDPAHLAGLRHLFTGGEALSVPHVRRAQAALPKLTLSNGYGPTECTTFAATHRIPSPLPDDLRSVPLGRPIKDTVLRVLSPSMALLPAGFVGELCIGGHGLARGYLRQPALSAERFVPDPFGGPDDRLYRTGDLARWLPDGTLEFIGRRDGQVKIHGHRIETGEVEAAILAHPAVQSCAVLARPDASGQLRLVAYLVARTQQVAWDALRAHLATRLPAALVPTAQVWLAQLPVTPNGKLDRKALPEPAGERPELAQPFEEAHDALEQQVCDAFAHALRIDKVGRNDNFFDLGGDSLLVLQVLAELQRGTGLQLSTNLFFRNPTPKAMGARMQPAGDLPATAAATGTQARPVAAAPSSPRSGIDDDAVALVGTAGRFPGAADVEQFWRNLVAGRDTITFFDDATLDAGVSQALRSDPSYVRARGVIDGIEDFDAAFFGIGPKEAQLMDPQQRVFLEICWECLERAGYVPDAAPGPVGVYAGMYNATYFQRHVSTRPDLVEPVGEFQVMLANEKDYITTRVANRLNLTGPAVSVHTACSTSLVAVAHAFHALRTGQCYMALAGGASVTCPPRSGYLYNEGSMLSPDGHTRSFDANAQGTVFSDGAAVVLLKRLADAQADGDTIYAVLRSAAVNNDGGAKASFTAPSVDGQAAVIRAALAAAGVDARSISYVEAHGTATPMGDPIEVEALAVAYAEHTDALDYCTLGSLKSNVGHMVTAAGAAGLIKTALALHHEVIPPTVHFSSPNPSIDFARTPFHVNSELQPWPRADLPRRAGVSSFGVGGTNAHVIVEEAPPRPASPLAAGEQVLSLSGRSEAALAVACEQLAAHLDAQAGLPLADVAHTLAVGRKAHAFRRVVVAGSAADASAALRNADSPWRASGRIAARAPQMVLMFPGQGAQYAGMGKHLHAADPVFAAAFDDCMNAFEGAVDFDLRARMFSDDPQSLAPTAATQLAIFALEYALARRVLSLGARPQALIGHSVGEFVAAVLAGVMRLEDAARLVARRGALMQAQPAGAMLSVRLGAAELLDRLDRVGPQLSLAAENGPTACVAAGPFDAIAALQAALEADGIPARALQTSHAFHSAMMDGAVAPFEALVRQVELHAPYTPIFSTMTGRLLEGAEATSATYWAQHLRGTVHFSPAVRCAMAQVANPLFVEAGPRNMLSTLVRQHGATGVVPLLQGDPADEARTLHLALGRLWTCGADVELSRLVSRTGAQRVQLPTTPFERKRFWVDIAAVPPIATETAPVAAPAPSPVFLVSPTALEPTVTAATPSPLPPPASNVDARLRTLFEDISGLDMAQAEGHAAFGELGLDSLTLTQAATQIKKHFKVNLSFRQLMENYRSFDALSGFLRESLPPEAAPVAAPAAAPVTAAAMPAPVQAVAAYQPVAMPMPVYAPMQGGIGGGDPLPQLISQQMELMRQQLALLSGAAQAAPLMTLQAMPVAQVAQVTQAAQPVAEPTAPAATAVSATPAADEPATHQPVRYDVAKAFGAIARIHTQRTAEPSGRQKARLAAFMRRYVERTQKSKQFTESNRPHMADPRVVNGFRPITKEITYQIVIERSKGSKMWDLDGNEYVDVLNGFGMNMFGWQPDFVQDAVRKQLDEGYEIGPQHPLAAEVTALICELTGSDRAGLCNTGSEAVMAALRIARTVTGRSTVVVFTGSYHGTFDEVLVRAGKAGKGLSAAPGVMSGMFGDIRVLDYGTPEALAFIRENADDLAAVLAEPVQSRRPDFQPREFLHEVRDITAKSGCCLIFDEVITGFRTALGGAQELFGVRADLATYGKVIGGGFPVGVIAGKREFMDALDGGPWQYGDDSIPGVGVTYFAGTFVRHPLALAAAKASLTHLKEAGPALQAGLTGNTSAMAAELSGWCKEVGAPIEIRHFASLWRVSWLEDHPLQDLLFAMMRSRGIHILDNFPCFLTSAHSAEDIAFIQRAFKESVAEMQESGFLPRRAAVVTGFDLRKPAEEGSVLARDVDGQPFWYVPDTASPSHHLINGKAAA
ncbi:amino acid adenylation domain-containing protein [Variovorax sp. OK605]|uniref:type I polyketide synthase n=1 Tax=Variovorax sp. OK605 TaxID=1855317 RepID=UPI0008E7AE7D|nr:type I polyketide synthase [Variovorax sp. OK605]SFO55273.1 amino acid adenylation domain-containing protein [Variovorax sp. OK605]